MATYHSTDGCLFKMDAKTQIDLTLTFEARLDQVQRLREMIDKFNANPQRYSVVVEAIGDSVSVKILPRWEMKGER